MGHGAGEGWRWGGGGAVWTAGGRGSSAIDVRVEGGVVRVRTCGQVLQPVARQAAPGQGAQAAEALGQEGELVGVQVQVRQTHQACGWGSARRGSVRASVWGSASEGYRQVLAPGAGLRGAG